MERARACVISAAEKVTSRGNAPTKVKGKEERVDTKETGPKGARRVTKEVKRVTKEDTNRTVTKVKGKGIKETVGDAGKRAISRKNAE